MTVPLAPLTQIPPHLIAVAQYEQQAAHHLDAAVWAYLQGGAMDEITLQANMRDWQDLQLVPRRLQALAGGHTRLERFGQSFASPIWLAPIAYQQLFHPDAEIATAHAAHVSQTPMLVSSFATRHFAEIAAHTTAPLWLQLYWQGSRAASLALVRQAEAAGYHAVVLTVDAPHMGVRDRERLAGFVLPAQIEAVNLHALPSYPASSSMFDGLFALAPTWDDVAWLKTQTHLPVLLKGILHPADAVQAVQLGVDGVVVSNHGGRVLDTCVSVVDALPVIRQVCPPDYPILVDSGLRRGTDIFKAIALGASAVLIGRPYIYGLSVAGALGVAHILKLLQEELVVTMGLCGCRHLEDIRQAGVLMPS